MARSPGPGSVVMVPLEDGRTGFGRLLKVPLVEFYDLVHQEGDPVPSAEQVVRAAVLFRVSVVNASTKAWKVLGHLPLSDAELSATYAWFKQDPISGALSIYWTDYAGRFGERPATLEECLGLECNAVWAGRSVVQRLKDLFDGAANETVERLRPVNPEAW